MEEGAEQAENGRRPDLMRPLQPGLSSARASESVALSRGIQRLASVMSLLCSLKVEDAWCQCDRERAN